MLDHDGIGGVTRYVMDRDLCLWMFGLCLCNGTLHLFVTLGRGPVISDFASLAVYLKHRFLDLSPADVRL